MKSSIPNHVELLITPIHGQNYHLWSNYLITLSSRNAQYKFSFMRTFTRKIQNIRKNHDPVRSIKLPEISTLRYTDKTDFNHLCIANNAAQNQKNKQRLIKVEQNQKIKTSLSIYNTVQISQLLRVIILSVHHHWVTVPMFFPILW